MRRHNGYGFAVGVALLWISCFCAAEEEACPPLDSSSFDLKDKNAIYEQIKEINRQLKNPQCVEAKKNSAGLLHVEAVLYQHLGDWGKALETRKRRADVDPTARVEIVYADLFQTPPLINEAYRELPFAREALKNQTGGRWGNLDVLDRYQSVYSKEGDKPLRLFFSAMMKGQGVREEADSMLRDADGRLELIVFPVADPKPLKELTKDCEKSILCQDALYALGECGRLSNNSPDDGLKREECELASRWDKGREQLEAFVNRFPNSRYAPVALFRISELLGTKSEAHQILEKISWTYPKFRIPRNAY